MDPPPPFFFSLVNLLSWSLEAHRNWQHKKVWLNNEIRLPRKILSYLGFVDLISSMCSATKKKKKKSEKPHGLRKRRRRENDCIVKWNKDEGDMCSRIWRWCRYPGFLSKRLCKFMILGGWLEAGWVADTVDTANKIRPWRPDPNLGWTSEPERSLPALTLGAYIYSISFVQNKISVNLAQICVF